MAKPKDLQFTFYDNEFCKRKMTFQFFCYGYDKGSDGRIIVETEETIGKYEDYRSDTTELHIKSKKEFAGLTYKDLMNLSKWAKDAANSIKRDCTRKGHRGPKFDETSTVND